MLVLHVIMNTANCTAVCMGGTMNKSELVKDLSESAGLSVDEANVFVDTFFDCVRKALIEDNRVEIRGFGSFKIKTYKGYTGRNPKTGQSVDVPPKRLPAFRAGKELKEVLNLTS